MKLRRRDFVKGCAAVSALSLPGIARVAIGQSTSNASASVADLHIEKSIKASFGGGFSVRTHQQSNGLTHANIEHLGNRYLVMSADLLDWKIVSFL
ncbi:twin-arginine translocation signal domain-containing protein [Alcaligenaceae bacterium CGII-47]|nr:twin-arginine translocation signal domain-containing protein [Alcaligenaceae bacterium CGII-47]